MDVHFRSQRGNNTSPDRAKICRLKQKLKPSRKVQVVYYLSRNGLLEHPHFMELTLLPNQPLRLKDVFDRLMSLRGSGMPLQYSWSSKRSYKSGYVWYDLALKDIIHPAEGGEYVLKGSELVEGCSERFNVSNKQGGIHQQAEGNYNYNYESRNKACKREKEREEYEEYEEEQEKEYEEGEKTSNTSSTTTPHSRCSRGVSTEELLDDEDSKNRTKEVGGGKGAVAVASGASSRYSVLLQLIACGSAGGDLKGKQGARLSDVGTKEREKKGLFWEEGEVVVSEKEYFSGSLVESIKPKGEPLLNKSNSYNEQRRSRLGIMEEEKSGGVKEKCIPLKKSPKQS
ncbi:Protein UPSTREAM OF FLC, partial [Mucuna pruriens]